MKKFYMFMGAALTAVTAVAVVNDKVENATLQQATIENIKEVSNDNAVLVGTNFGTRADETVGTPYIKSPVNNIFFFGMKPQNSYYAASIGFTPAWGKLNFSAIAEGATSYNWQWCNGYKDTYEKYKEYSVDGQNLEIDITPGIGGMIRNMAMTASNGTAQAVQSPFTVQYYTGGTPTYYSSNYADLGLTMYPRLDYKEDDKYMGTSVDYMSINKLPANAGTYDANGVMNYVSNGQAYGWTPVLLGKNSGSTTEDITDVKIDGFAYQILPMSSPYILSGMNVWANANFSEATTIQGWIYELNEKNQIMPKPIAKISANVAAGTPSENIVFDFIKVDEDGDEVEEDLIIDNKGIFIRIEGLSNNPAIQQFTPIYGNGTIWPTADKANSPWFRNSYVAVNYKLKGADKTYLGSCPYNYYADDARTQMFFPTNFLWSLDVSFPFVQNAATNGREFNVEIPVDGGEVVVNATSSWNLAVVLQREMMEGTIDGDWITCEVGAADEETGYQPITVKGTALPAGVEGRRGSINFKGMAADFTIDVTQGKAPAGVNDIVVDADVAPVYYDLQGRQVVGTPDKGVYIVKQGNKVNKVIL